MKKTQRFVRSLDKLGMTIILICAVCVVCGCRTGGSVMTVAPKPVVARVASDWAKRNIIDFDTTGVYVRADYVRVYKAMLAEYGKKLPVSQRPASPEEGITQKGPDRFHVTFEVRDRFDDLKYFERNSTP